MGSGVVGKKELPRGLVAILSLVVRVFIFGIGKAAEVRLDNKCLDAARLVLLVTVPDHVQPFAHDVVTLLWSSSSCGCGCRCGRSKAGVKVGGQR